MLTACTCAIRKAIAEHREDETDAIQTALRIGNVPDELRGFAMKKALTKPLLGFITDRTSFNLEGVSTEHAVRCAWKALSLLLHVVCFC